MATSSVRSDSGFVNNWQSGKSLAECNLHMLTSEESCDVTFRVGKDEKIVRAHRYVLISRSCVFNAMLCGPLAEKNEVLIKDVEQNIFTELLRYLYTNISEPTPRNVTGLLYLAKKYAVGGLEHLCLAYLNSSLSAENACVNLEQAHVFDEKQLYDTAMDVILDNGEKCLGSEDFKHLSPDCFHNVISSDCLSVEPALVFNAAMSWAEEKCKSHGREVTPDNLRSTLGQTLYSIPFPDMDQECYVKEVIPRQILTDTENVKIMSSLMCADSDPSPFKKRPRRKKAYTDHLPELATQSCNIVILCQDYLEHPPLCYRDIYSETSFIFTRDVFLFGLYVYGSTSSDDRYNLKIGDLNEVYVSKSSGKYKDQCVKTIWLKTPQYLNSSTENYIYVSLLDNREPQYFGYALCEQITVDDCVVGWVSHSDGQAGLIYGLLIQC